MLFLHGSGFSDSREWGPTDVLEADSRSAGLPGSRALTPESEVSQDADVSKVHPVAMGIQAEQKGPLEGDDAPDAGEVVAVGVYEACGERSPAEN